jgi:hypothetical protein
MGKATMTMCHCIIKMATELGQRTKFEHHGVGYLLCIGRRE